MKITLQQLKQIIKESSSAQFPYGDTVDALYKIRDDLDEKNWRAVRAGLDDLILQLEPFADM
jgi:hypothetical protein